MAVDLGIDLGTANTLIYDKRHGIVLNEPSMVVSNKTSAQVVAIGDDANDMMGRTPDGVAAVRPIRGGVITSFNATVSMLKHFIKKTAKNTLFKIRVVVCVPCSITEVERRAVQEAARDAGAKEVYLIEAPLAAAIGSGVDVSAPRGSMIVDIGAGITEVAVVSLGGIVVSHSIRIAGDSFDSAIVQYVKKKYNMMIGDISAENIKISIGSAYFHKDNELLEMKGRDLISGLPKTAKITSEEVREALTEAAEEIVDAVKATLETTPPELASDIMETGIVLAGGGAMLKGLGRLININTEIPVYISENPLECVAIGAGKSLESMTDLKFTLGGRNR